MTPDPDREDELKRKLQAGFGMRIRERREALGLTQEGVGEVSGLHRTYIGRVEGGKVNLSLFNIVRLARALDCDQGELISGLPD